MSETWMALSGDHAALLEELFATYTSDPGKVPDDWRRFFEQLEEGGGDSSLAPEAERTGFFQELGLASIMDAYRKHGHLAAQIDPLRFRSLNRRFIDSRIERLSAQDLARVVARPGKPTEQTSLQALLSSMETTYCGSIGAEHHYLLDDEERHWIQEQMEVGIIQEEVASATQLRLFEKVFQADYLEKFLAKKYVGKKRFSLEGGESLIALLDTLIEEAGNHGVKGLNLGMAHRGRLNVLVNTLKKPVAQLFAEFEEKADETYPFYSDVKYHLGFSNSVRTALEREVQLSLAFNPSHLEAVNPIVQGKVRAKQILLGSGSADSYIPVLLHGDAAFPGQGVVAETLNLMKLRGFTVGGTVHIVENNQIGFTTHPEDSRSTPYATDMAKGFQIPIFHVNGDDPEAVYRVMRLAFAYRMRFHNDVIIDLVCYRRHGHNEMDEPTFTQPVMYEAIRNHPVTWEIYEKRLLEGRSVSAEQLEVVKQKVRDSLQESYESSHATGLHLEAEYMRGLWNTYSPENANLDVDTRVSQDFLEKIASSITTIPAKINASGKLTKLLEHRNSMVFGETKINWGFAESLAFGTLLEEGVAIRFCGQDALRGTFSQRHLGVVDVKTNEEWIPLNHMSSTQKHIEVVNSALSEFSVLGFEYGYSLANPHALVLWEAQFGDFVNGAQIIIDQFIASSEVKWFRMSGLVMLLPHGFEGQGPEHSSARIERFLQLCADNNLTVANCSTPAQYFHLLRRQVLQQYRKPLILFTPKSLLRHPLAGSSVSELVNGSFQPVLDHPNLEKKEQITRILICSGKVYYDLLEFQTGNNITDTAIVRLERYYPFPDFELNQILASYPKVKVFCWVQEEPENQGAYHFVRDRIGSLLPKQASWRYVGRKEGASPATGLAKIHLKEQDDIVARAFTVL